MRKDLVYPTSLDGVMNSRALRLVRRMVTLRRFITTLVVFVAISEFGLFPQLVKRGFYCDDRSIQRPFNGDTVSTGLILSSGFVPLLLLWITEVLFYPAPSSDCTRFGAPSSRYKAAWHQSWYWFEKYGRGLLFKLLIVDTLKIFAGEHRPHFLDTCKPDVICTGNEFVTTYTCTNTEDQPYFIRDASKSFPSGHSSVSVYGVIFMIWYLQKRVPRLQATMALPLVQFLIATWAIFCSLSRIIDNRHHWWDVLAGSIIGAVAAVLICIFSCHNFDRTKSSSNQPTHRDHDIKLIANNVHFKESNNLNNIVSSP